MTIDDDYGDYMDTITAAEFKAKCLKLMDVVAQGHKELVITKRGVPVAKIVPIEEPPTAIWGIARFN